MIPGLVLAAMSELPDAAAAAQVERTNVRYDEDWSQLRGEVTPDVWWRRLKDRPIDDDGDLRIMLGAEARARYEGFDNNLAGEGASADDGYFWLRVMPLADVRAGPARAFVQGVAGYTVGLDGDPGPADETGLDLLQAFADVTLPLADRGEITLRGGRELVALGSERLVGLRYGPNIPQPFDGVRLMLTQGGVHIQAFQLRPVATGPGNFNDKGAATRELKGVYATLPLGISGKADVYWLRYSNDHAQFGNTTALEQRDTYGARVFGREGALSWNWEAMLQRGRFGGTSIRAWSAASKTGYAFDRAPLTPRLRLRANVASGDLDPDDAQLNTFNAMFPKGKYFGELTPIGPRNIINLNPSVAIDLGRGVTAELAGGAFWRASTRDGVYDIPGQLIRSAGDVLARHIGNQLELIVGWQPDPVLSFSASISAFAPGDFMRASGSMRPIRMLGVEAMLRF